MTGEDNRACFKAAVDLKNDHYSNSILVSVSFYTNFGEKIKNERKIRRNLPSNI